MAQQLGYFSGFSGLPRQRKYGMAGFSGYAQGGGAAASASPSPTPPGYYDLPGSGILPGGNLSVSPGKGGVPRSIPGIDIPVVGYPNTGWSGGPLTGDYQSSILGVGLPIRSDRGGPGGSSTLIPFDPMGYGLRPPNEDVSPTPRNNWLLDATNTDANGNPLPSGVGRYPDLSGMPPVTVNAPNWPRAIGATTGAYPIPGGGLLGNRAGDWVRNATWGSPAATAGPSKIFEPRGFFGGITTTSFPSWGAGFGSVGNSGYGNQKQLL